jgi:N-acetyl-anhydromuramyl-L-alanine amidase AmpD
VPTHISGMARYLGGPRRTTNLVVWHATAGASAASSLNWHNREGVPSREQASYHAIIERDGRVYLAAPVHRTAYHAGVSAWPVVPGQPIKGSLNSRSIGIAFANRQVPQTHAHFERVTDAQLDAAIELLLFWKERYPWIGDFTKHVRHRDVSPQRRQDPLPETLSWPAFLTRIQREVGGP